MIGIGRAALAALVLVCTPAAAQTGAAAQAGEAPAGASDVEAVVVTARRIGVPVWRVGDHLILVGHIQAVPKDAEWRPEELGRAVAQADAVVFPHAETATPADIVRVLWRARSVVLLPKGRTLAEYVDAATMARLEAFRAKGVFDEDFVRIQPWALADDLIESAGVKTRGEDLARIMRREARRQRKDHEVVGRLTAETRLDSLLRDGPGPQVPCLKAALDTAEAPPGAGARRIADYTAYRVAAVVRSPVEQALGACWLTGADEATTARLRTDWRSKILPKADGPDVTLAVVPLRFLAEEGGLLDAFAAGGRQVDGPRWRD